ncbi:MAG: hypothetical protein ACYDHW_05765 [Syntrophorhabdaceae bacterium]
MPILINMDLFKEMDRREVIQFICVLGVAVLMPHSANPKEIEKLLDNEDREGF